MEGEILTEWHKMLLQFDSSKSLFGSVWDKIVEYNGQLSLIFIWAGTGFPVLAINVANMLYVPLKTDWAGSEPHC